MGDVKSGNARDLSVLVEVSRLAQDGSPVRHTADEAERRAVAARFGIVAVERLEVDLVARRWRRDGVAVEGALIAGVLQTDVVTLEPVPQAIEEEVRLFFVPEHSRLAAATIAAGTEIDVDPAEDVPETFHGDRIELGEALTQILGLALDPYPRGSDVEFEGGAVPEKEPSPFAVLAALKTKTDG
jgi:uncharacterized metal-binding protein YceD (DUF177 family)